MWGMQVFAGKKRVTAKIDPSGVCREKISCNSNVYSVKSGFIVVAQMFNIESALLLCMMCLSIVHVWG